MRVLTEIVHESTKYSVGKDKVTKARVQFGFIWVHLLELIKWTMLKTHLQVITTNKQLHEACPLLFSIDLYSIHYFALILCFPRQDSS